MDSYFTEKDIQWQHRKDICTNGLYWYLYLKRQLKEFGNLLLGKPAKPLVWGFHNLKTYRFVWQAVQVPVVDRITVAILRMCRRLEWKIIVVWMLLLQTHLCWKALFCYCWTKPVTSSYAWSGVLPLRPGCNLAIQILAAVLKRWVLVVQLMKTEEDQVLALIPLFSYCNFQRWLITCGC